MLGGAVAVGACGNAPDSDSKDAQLSGCSGGPEVATLSPGYDQSASVCVPREGDACLPAEDEPLREQLANAVATVQITACTDCQCYATLSEVQCGSYVTESAMCCYDVAVDVYEHCGKGRDLVIDGELVTAPSRERSDWADAPRERAGMASDAARALLAELWTRDGLLEHASVGAFARFSLEALAVGAPAHILRDTQVAAADEVRHAEMCFALAARYGGCPVGPGELRIGRQLELRDSLAEIAAATVIEGCIGETISAFRAMAARDVTTDGEVREVLACIGRDEATHAELAWRFVAWAIERGGAEVARAVADAFERGAAMAADTRGSLLAGACVGRHPDLDAELEAHGRLSRSADVIVRDEVWAKVIRPAAHALRSGVGRGSRSTATAGRANRTPRGGTAGIAPAT